MAKIQGWAKPEPLNPNTLVPILDLIQDSLFPTCSEHADNTAILLLQQIYMYEAGTFTYNVSFFFGSLQVLPF